MSATTLVRAETASVDIPPTPWPGHALRDEPRQRTMARIAALPTVRWVKHQPDQDRLAIRFHYRVLAGFDNYTDRERYFRSGRLIAHIPYHPQPFAMPLWQPFSTARMISPHPHIHEIGAACWGDADVPVRQALERQDYFALAVLLSGFISQYYPADSLHDSSDYPRVRAGSGWYQRIADMH